MLLHKEQFVVDTNIVYMDNGQFGENLAQSEDNKLLELIYNKFVKIDVLKKSNIWKAVEQEDNVLAVVLWNSGYFNIEEKNHEGFKPYWQDQSLDEKNGYHYKGSLHEIPIYEVYKLKEYKKYSNSLFIFKQNSLVVKEFEIEDNQSIDLENSKVKESITDCLSLSITNLSVVEQERIKIVDSWIEKGTLNSVDREDELEKIKSNVLFKFFKGFSINDTEVNTSEVKVFNIK